MKTKQIHNVKVCLLGFFAFLTLLLTVCGMMFCYTFTYHDVDCVCKTCEMLCELDNVRQGYIKLGIMTATFYWLTFDAFYYFLKEIKNDV